MFAGMLALVGIAGLCTGHYLQAVNSFIYTFIVFMATAMIAQNKRLRELLVMQHLIICELEKRLKNQPVAHYINCLFHITGYRVISSRNFGGIPEYLVRFPYTKSSSAYGRDLHDQPQYDWDNLGYELNIGAAEYFFICAPAKDMEKMHRVYSISAASDPFVCAHTDCGILVFTRWGEEADDKVVRKYEQASRWLDRAKEFINSQPQPQRSGGFID